jgi:hypothetical protein
MAKKKEPHIVRVEWLDAASSLGDPSDSEELDSISDFMTVSVGFLVKKNKKGIFLSTDWVEGKGAGALHFVPNGMVKKLSDLGASAPKPKRIKKATAHDPMLDLDTALLHKV